MDRLLKPCTVSEYEDFKNYCVAHNLLFIETEQEIISCTEEEQKQQRKQEILQELDNLDLKSIRAIRANDTEYIEKYEAQAELLRQKLKELG